MRHCILEDSSFLIGTIDTKDKFHKYAIGLEKVILNHPDISPKIWRIFPSIVLLETTAVLLRRGMSPVDVETKLWNFLHLPHVLPVSVPETLFIKFVKLPRPFWELKTSDLTLTTLAVQYDAQILTFDKKLKNRISSSYRYIYNCSNKDEIRAFVEDLFEKIQK